MRGAGAAAGCGRRATDDGRLTRAPGMFSFTGLTEAQVLRVRDDAHIYMTKNGRASIAGLNSRNVEYVARAIDKAVRDTAPN